MTKIFTGIGSREIPDVVAKTMTDIGYDLAEKGCILRSGKAKGSDAAFQLGVESFARLNNVETFHEIYIPWKGFKGGEGLEDDHDIWELPYSINQQAREIVRSLHSAWDLVRKDGTPVLTEAAKKLHTRNVYQVLGQDLKTPSDFVVFYAPPVGRKKAGEPLVVKGGTNTAVALAQRYDIPVYNLFDDHQGRGFKYFLENILG